MVGTLITLLLAGPGATSIDLHPLTTGATRKIGGYMPQRLELSPDRPATVKNVPAGAALFGTWKFGGKAYPVLEIQANGVPKAFEVDFSGFGDFGSAKPVVYQSRQGVFFGDIEARCPITNGELAHVPIYRFDPSDARRPQLKNTVLYYSDYALEGTLTLNGKPYHAMVCDTMAAGEFAGGEPGPKGAPVAARLLIDRNGDGRYVPPAEWYDASKPFNIDGVTYALTGLSGDGSHLAVGVSNQTVAEIPMPPDLSTGHKIVAFTATDRSGNTVHFPEDFKGKVVMLDFWATWCGPCMGEVPNVVKVYNQLHPKGFEILGISLDNAQTIKDIPSVTQAKGMTWDQIADGKYWDAAIAKLYGIQAIPAAYIVDGDTGKIYAEGESIRGDNLLPAVQKALASKGM